MIYTISQICSNLSKTILNISIHSRNKTIQFLPSFGNILAVTIPRHLCFRSARARRPNPSLLSPSPNNINSNRSSGALSLVLHLRISPPPLSPPPLFPFPVGSWKKVISSLVFHLDFIPDFILCRYRVTDKSGFVALFLYSCNYRLIFFLFNHDTERCALLYPFPHPWRSSFTVCMSIFAALTCPLFSWEISLPVLGLYRVQSVT